jgi:hypothetical protein
LKENSGVFLWRTSVLVSGLSINHWVFSGHSLEGVVVEPYVTLLQTMWPTCTWWFSVSTRKSVQLHDHAQIPRAHHKVHPFLPLSQKSICRQMWVVFTTAIHYCNYPQVILIIIANSLWHTSLLKETLQRLTLNWLTEFEAGWLYLLDPNHGTVLPLVWRGCVPRHSRCLRPQIVLGSMYTVFSYTYIPMVKFNLLSRHSKKPGANVILATWEA